MNEFNENIFRQPLINPAIARAVEELGFETMTPIQAQAIPFLLEGLDIIGQAQTGTGKTASFGIPMLQNVDPDNKALQAIVLCPTRELAMQAAEDLRSFAKYMQGVKVLPVYGGQNIQLQIRGLKNTQIIVGTPGRVMDHMRRKTIRMDEISMVVLDEADEMLNMGFLEDMEVILNAIEHPHQTCLFSATMPQEILDISHRFLTDPKLIRITKKELTTDLIRQYYYPVKREYKIQAAERLLLKYRYTKTMIFCNTKHMADELATALQKSGFTAEALHGDLNQKQRDTAMARFREGAVQILTATDIAARGIDVDDVEAVINFDVPQELEYYVHRIGRTGRAGKEGVSHTLCGSRDFRQIRSIEAFCHIEMEERAIPSPEEIKKERQSHSLDDALRALTSGKSGAYIPVIRDFCRKYAITPEELAAAYLKKDLGSDLDMLPLDLPGKPEKTVSRKRSSEDASKDAQKETRDKKIRKKELPEERTTRKKKSSLTSSHVSQKERSRTHLKQIQKNISSPKKRNQRHSK